MARGPSFTPLCYGIIGVLVERPDAVFSLTEQRVCERMEKHGWLTRRLIELPQQAGTFTYTSQFVNFVPTENGLKLWSELNKIVGRISQEELRKAMSGERHKTFLLKKLDFKKLDLKKK